MNIYIIDNTPEDKSIKISEIVANVNNLGKKYVFADGGNRHSGYHYVVVNTIGGLGLIRINTTEFLVLTNDSCKSDSSRMKETKNDITVTF